MSYNGDYRNDIEVACELGSHVIKALNPLLKNQNKLLQTENMDNELAKILDRLSGIDAVMINKNGISGVGLRIQQYKNKSFHTFTIRYKRSNGSETEYAKRKRQIYEAEPTLYPHYTLQAYLDDNRNIISGAFCKTKSIFDACLMHEPFETRNKVYIQKNTSDGNEFLVVPYSEVTPIVVFGQTADIKKVKFKEFGRQLHLSI